MKYPDSAPESSERGYCMHEYGNRHLTHDALVTTDNVVLVTLWQPFITDNAMDTKAMPIYVSQTSYN